MTCGADITANTLLISLIGDKSFALPDVDLTGEQFQIPSGDGFLTPVVKLTTEELTTRVVDGSGVFDALMSSLSAHLKKEYENNRITGEQYTKAYISSIQGALQTGASFLLGRDQAYWQAILAQQQARLAEVQVITARVQLETAKATLSEARIRNLTAEAEFGLTKMKIASEDQQYCLLLKQTEMAEVQLEAAQYNNLNLLPLQKQMLEEQVEVQRAQTLDTRTNGDMIKGSVGKQKDLYTQQIISYQRDAEVKAAKLFTDAWITQKTIDELTPPPGSFRIESLNAILRTVKANNNIEDDPGPQDGDP